MDVAANKKLTDEQYQAIVDYATRNHLTVKGLSKQEQATHKTTASGEDLSGKFFATGSTKKGAAHDGDTITLDGDTITISLDSTKYHYLTKAETEALLDYIQSNNLKLVDNTVKSITTITFTDGTTGHSKTDGGHTKDDMLGYETRTSDPLVFLLGDTDVTGWNSIVIETSNGTDSTQSGNQRGQNTLFATGAYASHTYTAVVNGKVGAITIMSDAIVSIGEYSDTDSWFNIKNSDGSYANEKFVDAKDGNITAGKGPDGQYSKVILTDDQVQQLLRGMAYVANHPGTSITYNYSATEFNSENNGPDSEGRRGLDDFPVGSQKDFTGDIIVNVVDQDGNVIYSETDKANGGIANPKDATDAGLKDDSDDVKAKGSVDINDVLNNLFAGKNADGTEGTIKYIAGDGNEIWTDGTTTVEVSFTEAANGGVTVTYHVVDNTQASATVSYVDEDGNVISSEDVSGQVNSGVDYTVTPPDGWVIDSDKSPDYTAGETTSVKVTSDDSDNITIYVKHGTHEDTPTDPSDPNYDATHATSTETITYVNQDGDPMTGDEFATVTHTLDYTRTVIIDDVTGEVVGYGDWTPVDGDEFGAVTSPDKPGYTVDTDEVPAQGPTITNGTDGAVSDVNVTVTYTADDAEATVTYVDDDEDGAVVGDVTTKTGKTDGTVDVTISIPDGYEYVGTDGGVVSADGKTVTITFTADDADNIVIHLKHGTRNLTPDDPNYDEEASYNVIESIEYVDAKTGKKLKPNGSQTVSFTRDVVVDAVTGEVVSYGDWVADFGDTFPAYDAPTINGYFAGRQQVPESDAQVPGESEDFTEIIYYYSTEQTVEPTDPKNEGDKLGPSDPNSPTYPDGVSEDDLNQDVTETITYVNGENGKEIATTYTHTVHYTRNATITYNTDGTVAGIHYGDWVADDGESFPAIDSPVIAGYTPDQTSVDTQPDTTSQDKMPDINETVTYTADPAEATVTYVDDDKNGATVGDVTTVTGKTDGTTTVTVNIPDGYVYVGTDGVISDDGKTITITFTADDTDNVVVHLKHDTKTVDPTDPDDPYYADTHTTADETITYVDQDGHSMANRGVDDVTTHLDYTRSVVVDAVTGDIVSYGDWTPVDGDEFAAVSSKDVAGYTVDTDEVAAQGPTITNGADGKVVGPDVTVTYTAQDETATVHYIDEDDGNKEVKTDTITGKTDSNGDYVIDIPAGYEIDGAKTEYANGDTVTVVISADDADDITIYLKHGKKKIDPDNPADPSNPDQKDYTQDTHTSSNEVIHYVDGNGKIFDDDTSQTIDYERSVEIDAVTGEIISYGDWEPVDGDGTFGDVTSPTKPGYTPDQTVVSGEQPTITDAADGNDVVEATHEVTVTYTADDAEATVTYVDDDKNGATVGDVTTVTGKTDGTTTVTVNIPDGYVYVGTDGVVSADGKTITITFTADDTDNVVVHLKHDTKTVDPTDPDDPYYAGTHTTADETITYVDQDGHSMENRGVDDVTAHLDYTRTATVDAVTGEVISYGDWTPVDGDEFAAVSSKDVPGYTVDTDEVPAQSPTISTDKDGNVVVNGVDVTVTYTAEDEDATIHYIDEDDNNKEVKTDTITGKTDSNGDFVIDIPAGYEIDGAKTEYANGDTVTVVISADDADDITIYMKHGKKTVDPTDPDDPYYADTHTTADETITYVDQDGHSMANRGVDDVTSHLDYTRSVVVDEVTGDIVSYGDWTPVDGDEFAAVSSKDVPGYTVDTDEVPAQNPTITNGKDGKVIGSDVTVTYTAEDETATVHYIDEDNNNKEVKTDTITGKTDSNGDYVIDIPAGYEIDGAKTEYANGDTVTVTISADDADDITIYLKHGKKTIDPDNPADPSNPDQKDYTQDTHTSSNEVIHYVDDNGKVFDDDTSQTIDYERSVEIDAVTGEIISYGDWEPVDGDGTFGDVTSPTKPGYTPDQTVVSGEQPTITDAADGNDVVEATHEVTVHYTAEDETATVHYIDEDNNNKEVKTDTITGKTDSNGDYVIDIPAGYEIDGAKTEYANGDTVTVVISADDADDITIYLKHGKKTIDPDNPADPSNPDQKDYTQDTHTSSNEVIHYVDDNGKVFDDNTSQTIDYERSVEIDAVTGEIISYGDWEPVDGDGTFGDVTSPTKPGYAPDQTVVSGEQPTITDAADGNDVVEATHEVTVHYTAQDETATVHYIDEDNNNKEVKTDTITGKTDSNGDYVIDIPAGYEIDGAKTEYANGDTVTVVISADDADDITIYLKHGKKTIDPDNPADPSNPDQKDYTQDTHTSSNEVIHYVDDNGKVFDDDTSQTIDYERSVEIDAVTGEIISYGDWEPVDGDGTFGDVTSPTKPGYTPDQTVVSGEQPTITDAEDGNDVVEATHEVTVHYTAEDETATVHYIDEDDSNKEVKTDTITGKTDSNGDYVIDIPAGYEIDGAKTEYANGDTVTVVISADDADDITIYLKHHHQTVDPTNPDDPHAADYVKDTTWSASQTVHYVDKDGNPVKDDTSTTLDYTRSIVIDEVTGEILSYGDWTPTTDDAFAGFDAPTVPGYFADQQHIDEVAIAKPGEDGQDSDITIHYYSTDQTVDPSDPKNDGDKVDPSNPNSPVYPGDVTNNDLNADVTETIHYVDGETGEELADTYTVTVHYTRTGTVHYDEHGNYINTTYSDWKADGSFVDVPSPDVKDYFTTQTVVDGSEVTDPQNQDDFDVTVKYYNTNQTVDPSDPKDDGDKINPDDPNSPVYPGGVTEKDLNATVTETVHYVDENGNELAGTYTHEVHYSRKGYVTYDPETGEATVTYGDWVADGSFDDVPSPDINDYFTLNKDVAGKTVTDPQNPGDMDETVIYYKKNQTVDPTDPKNDGDKVNPDDPNSPAYPSGVSEDDLNADVTQTIHYVDENGNELADTYTVTVHYSRKGYITYDENGKGTVTYGDWEADGSFNDVPSPDVAGYFTLDKDVAGKTVTDPQNQADFEDTVIYYPTSTDVKPDDPKHDGEDINTDDPDSPKYPAGVDDNDLNAYVTQTVHYVDENGNEVAGDYTVTVHYTRTAHITYDQDGNATVTYSDWSADGSFNDVPSPDVAGYFTLDKDVAGKTVTDPQNQADFEDTVIYYPTSTDVKPDDPKHDGEDINTDDPDSPKYPAGVDDNDLNAYVTQTVHYVDENGNEVAGDYTVTVHYTRTAHITYDQDGNATVTYSDWEADGSFDAVTSPDVDGYFTTQTVVDGKTVTDPQSQADFDETVKYYKTTQDVDPDDPKDDGDKINPDDPNSPVYPSGVDDEDLNQYVTETVHYVDAETGKELADTYTKTVHYTRHATITYDKDGNATVTYGDWKADGTFDDVASPDVDGYFADRTTVDGRTMTEPGDDFDETVKYYKTTQDVDPDDPKDDGDKINPDDPNSPVYPSGVDDEDLNQYVTETVHYVDAETGKELADTYTKTVHYTRHATITYDKDGNATVTYGDWKADGTFDDVASPDVDGYFADRTTVDGRTMTKPGDDFSETVYYYKDDVIVTPDDPKNPDTPIDPDNPNSPDYPAGVTDDDLNQYVTETVHYVDAETGKELADTYTKTVHYTRTAHVTYDKDGNATVTYGDWSADGSFDAVDSPDIDGYVADRPVIDGRTMTEPGADFNETVYYYDADHTVTPDSPKHDGDKIDPSDPYSPAYPAGVDESDLNKDVTETIHYVDGDTGEELADTYTRTVHYTREAHVHFDADGNATVTYGEWVADGSFEAVESPDVDGYVADEDVIAALDNPTGDVDLVVTYHHAEVAPTPAPAPEEPSAPAPKPAPKPAPAPAKKVEPVHETRAARYGHVEAKKLPQTGDDDNTSMSAVGVLGLLAGSLGIFGLAKKRKRDGEE